MAHTEPWWSNSNIVCVLLSHAGKYCGESTLDHRCFRCGQLHEDLDHVLSCPSPSASRARASGWLVVTSTLKRCNVDTYFRLALEAGHSSIQSKLTPVWPHPPPTTDYQLFQLVFSAFEAQNSIVWSNALRGRLASEWFSLTTAVATNPISPLGLGFLFWDPPSRFPAGLLSLSVV